MHTSPPSLWETQSIRAITQCPVFELEAHRCRRISDNKEAEYFILKNPDWVNVVALTPGRRIVLVRQFRFGTMSLSWELPGGIVEKGESPLDAGMRELTEETGFTGSKVTLFARCHPNPAIMDNTCHYLIVEDAHPTGSTDWDENEELETCTIPLEFIPDWIRDGRISHANAHSALFQLSLFYPHLFKSA